ncbi:MAG: hypothetical protein VSS75_001170, partial [Candidatus Parabeggiatoa sp.]|nr:hypothetical protein [Candidatus Parabeggiatoa sp.]
GDYTLTFSKPNEVSSTLCWSAKTETSELGALRNQVEETAHLAYVKSIAYWRCGRFLRREKKAFTQALKILRLGIDTLDYRYLVEGNDGMLDDTGMGLFIAAEQKNKGKLDVASYCLEHTLCARLCIYAEAFSLRLPDDVRQASYPVFNPNKNY